MRPWSKSREAGVIERVRAAGPLDAGETRAILVAAVVLAFFLYLIKLILLPFVMAAIVAYVCSPLVNWAARRTRWPRWVFAVVAFAIVTAVVVALLVVSAERLSVEARGTANDLSAMLEHLTRQTVGDEPINLFGLTMSTHDIVQSTLERMRDWFGQTDQIAAITTYGFEAVMGGCLTIVLLLYFMVGGPQVGRGLFWLVPPHRRPMAAQVWARLDPLLFRYFVGVFAVVIYATVAAYIGLGVILGIEHAVLLALLTGLLETVPMVGSTVAAVIAGLVALRTATGIMNIVEYAIYATVLRLSIDQVVAPIVLDWV